MKILHIISSTNPKGGGPIEGVRQLQFPLSESGHDIDVVCCDEPNAPWLQGREFKIHALGPHYLGYAYTPRLVPWLMVNVPNYDAVIVNGIWQYHSFAVWQVLAGSKTPYFVFTHGMLDPWFKHTYPLKHFKKWLYWPWAEYRVLRDARAVIFTCEEERLLARQSFWLYKANEVVTNYGTASPPENEEDLKQLFFDNFPALEDKRIVLFLSRIHEKKGCDLLIEAFARVVGQDERLHLVMAGPDQTGWAKLLKEQASRLGIADKITWTGMLQGDLKWGAFYACEVFCLPSHQENFGIVVAEALACGKPVLISNKVNIWREIEEDGAGIVYDDSIDGTVKMLRHWLELNSEQYAEICTNAYMSFQSRFDIKNAAAKLASIIMEHR